MANMKQFSQSESKHLKAKDFLGKHLRVLINDVQVVEFDATKDAPASSKAVLTFEGKEKGLVLNATNAETLCKAYGEESDGWIGRHISLTTAEYDNFPPGWVVAALDVEYDDDIPM